MIRKFTVYEVLFAILSLFVIMASTDPNAVGRDEPTLYLGKKILFFTVFDLVLTICAILYLSITQFKIPGRRYNLYLLPLFSLLLIVCGSITARFSDYSLPSLVGPELRGLYSFCIVSLVAYGLLSKGKVRVWHVPAIVLSCLLVRAAYELILIEGQHYFKNSLILDMSQLIFMAVLGVTALSLSFVNVGYERAKYVALFLLLLILVSLGFRRTPMLVFIGGAFMFMFTIIFSRGALSVRRIATIIALPAGGAGLLWFDFALLDGRYSERLLSITEFDAVEGTSNYEHLQDFYDAFNVIAVNPFLGAGLGTSIPGRILSSYGENIPFHSPYLHSWVRFGILGLISYIALAWWIFMQAFFFLRKMVTIGRSWLVLLGFSFAIALSSYLVFNVAMPPFYLDPKLTYMVGIWIAVIFACKESVRHEEGRAKALRECERSHCLRRYDGDRSDGGRSRELRVARRPSKTR